MANHQIRLTIVHRSTSSNFHFFPLPFFTSTVFSSSSGEGKVRVLETVWDAYGRSSSSLERYSLVRLLYSYTSATPLIPQVQGTYSFLLALAYC